MEYGLRVIKDGVVQVDTTKTLGRIIGSVYTNAVDGSLSVPQFNDGKPFAQMMLFAELYSGDLPRIMRYPVFSISGTTLYWSYRPDDTSLPPSGQPSRCPARIDFGLR